MQLRTARQVAIMVVLGLGALGTTAQAQVQAPTVTVAGVGYVNYAYQLKTDSSIVPVGHSNNFDVTRAYIRAMGKFAGGVQTQVTVDVDGRKASSNQLTFRLKYAFVAYTPEGSPLTYKLGLIQTPWNDFEETLWDYRMQGTIPMERAGYISSADFGAGIDGMWGHDKVAVQAGIYNGEGYSNTPGDAHKDLSGRVSVRLARTDLAGKVGGLRLSAYGHVGASNGGGARTRFIGMLSYKSKAMTLAAEIGGSQDSTSVATPKQKGQLLAVYGVFNIPKSNAAVLARVDQFDPNTDSTAATAATRLAVNKQTRVIAGMSYRISPNLRVLADVDLNSIAGGSPTNAFDRNRQTLYFHTEFKF